jgi:hypothetical protein
MTDLASSIQDVSQSYKLTARIYFILSGGVCTRASIAVAS